MFPDFIILKFLWLKNTTSFVVVAISIIARSIVLECLGRREEKEGSWVVGVHLNKQQCYSWISASLIIVWVLNAISECQQEFALNISLVAEIATVAVASAIAAVTIIVLSTINEFPIEQKESECLLRWSEKWFLEASFIVVAWVITWIKVEQIGFIAIVAVVAANLVIAASLLLEWWNGICLISIIIVNVK